MTPAVTFFSDYAAKTKGQRTMTMEELADLIRTTAAQRKEELPWLKLARFGNAFSTNGSLRWDRNVIAITGIEGDYDGEKVPFAAAGEAIEKAGLQALVYTSPSYTPDKPRWRVLCATSRGHPPEKRAQFVSRINGLLGGILGVESWTLSQAYYYGAVNNNPDHRVEVFDGEPIDELDELDAIAIGKPGTHASKNAGNGAAPSGNGRVDEAALLDEIMTGASFHTAAARLLGSWALHGVPLLEAKARLETAFEGVFPPDRDARWQSRKNEIPRMLRDIYGKEAGKRDQQANDAQASPLITPENGAAFTMEKVDWLWRGWLARGKFHLLAGAKSAGKSTIVFDFMANLTVGGTWPDGTPAPLGDVIMWSGEDGIEDTILPRFVAAGGDLQRIYPIKDVFSNGSTRRFDPSTDIQALINMAETLPGLVAVAFDPVVMAIPSKADSHKNTETRRGLQPLVDLAERRNVALIGVTHFTKGTAGLDPVERVTGSLAFGALPRVVLAASADEDGMQRRLVRVASNIGPTGGGIEYTLFQAPLDGHDFAAQRIAWGKQLNGSAMELLNATKRSAEAEAAGFLTEFLKDGAKPQSEIKDACDAHGHAWRTVRRAQNALGIKPEQNGRKWCWRLPEVVDTSRRWQQ